MGRHLKKKNTCKMFLFWSARLCFCFFPVILSGCHKEKIKKVSLCFRLGKAWGHGLYQNKGQPQVKCGLWMKLMGLCVCRYMGVQILRERLGGDANVWYCPSDEFAVISYPQNLITCYKQDLSNVKSYLLFATTHLEFVLCHSACPPIILARIFFKENVI